MADAVPIPREAAEALKRATTGMVNDALALAGFLSPWPFIGWLPIGAGLCWAAYDLVDVKDTPTDGNTSRTAPRPER